jgi:predicted lipid-binding transport protein (Tim44 family)
MAVVGLFIHFQFNNSEEDGIQKRDRKIYDELNELKQSMKTLSYGEIIELAQEKFFMIQEAWSNQDLASLAQLLTSSLYFKWRVKIQEQQTLGERNDLEDLKMHDMKLVDLTLSREGGLRAFCVYLEASCIDSMIDQQGRTLSFNHGHFIEYWYFENEKGAIKLARVGQKEDWERLSKKSNQGLFGP